MERAHVVAERDTGLAPSADRSLVRTALEAQGFSTRRCTPGWVEAVRGPGPASRVGLTDRSLVCTVAVVGTPERSRALTSICLDRPTTTDAPGLADEVADLLAVQQALDAAWGHDGSGPGASPPLLVVPAASTALYAAVFADPLHRALVQGQVRWVVGTGAVQAPDPVACTVDAPWGTVALAAPALHELLELAAYLGGDDRLGDDDLQRTLTRLSGALWAVEHGLVARRLRLDDAGAHALDAVHGQLVIRRTLPIRVVQVCRDCRFEKVVNPDLTRLTRRNQRIKNAIGVAGAAVFPGATPITVAARALATLNLDPDFVCPRCQGLTADTRQACICPACGQLRKEALLRTCANAPCGHRFAGSAPPPTLFVDPRPVRTPAHPGSPTTARSGGGWFTDPFGTATFRWFDGHRWTTWVSDGHRSTPTPPRP